MAKINILGVNISLLEKSAVLKKIEQFLLDGKKHYLVTPNPEIILAAQSDEEFFYILNQADLAVPDGVGLKFAAWLCGRNLKRITGADLIKDILKMAEEKKMKAAILNWSGGLSGEKDLERTLKIKYPLLKFSVKNLERKVEPAETDAEIIFVSLGAPWQEKLIYHNLNNWKNVKLAIGVGGGFDFLTGKMKRAPEIMRALGMEWLWRLIKQPWRIKRIFNAVIVFPSVFLKWRFWEPFFYRPNIACLLYKKEGSGYKILLAERRDEAGHWQLPQGGTDGEDLMTAGARELREEIGGDKFKPEIAFKNLYKYKFPKSFSYHFKHGGYKGQKQGLFIAEFFGRDEMIKINFWDHQGWKWVEAENLASEVHPVRREATKKFLGKFKEFIAHNS